MILTKISASSESQSPLHSKLFLQILRKPQIKVNSKDSGFTLIELLVAMVILTIVVGITGTGLVFVMSTNTKSDGQITQQSNLRRAADFIADEVKSSSVAQTNTTGLTWPSSFSLTIPAQSIPLYLEIPTSINSVVSTLITVPNHGLVVGNAVKFSGDNLLSATGVNPATTYYVITADTDTFKIATNATDTTTTIPSATTTNFAIRRLVVYYIASPTVTQGKGPQALYRSTGNCSVPSSNSNCLMMVDSLIALPTVTPTALNSPFFPSPTTDNKLVTLNFNGQLCTPPTIANICPTPSPTPDLTYVKINAVSRGTLK